jgi:hypothetical protein
MTSDNMLETEIQNLISDFLEAARIAAVPIRPEQVAGEVLTAPHRRPKRLPFGKQGVYWFSIANICLKVGKAGALSNARFTSQHYNPKSSGSNLAKSILNSKKRLKVILPDDIRRTIDHLTEANVGDWIETHTTRFNIFIGVEFDDFVLSFLESFIQCRLKPIFEGKGL